MWGLEFRDLIVPGIFIILFAMWLIAEMRWTKLARIGIGCILIAQLFYFVMGAASQYAALATWQAMAAREIDVLLVHGDIEDLRFRLDIYFRTYSEKEHPKSAIFKLNQQLWQAKAKVSK